MVRVVTRLAGVLRALAGLALAAVGVWFAAQLGGTGTATFTTSPGTARPVPKAGTGVGQHLARALGRLHPLVILGKR